jgi:hypothetical protein
MCNVISELTVQGTPAPEGDAAVEFHFDGEPMQFVTITADLPLAQDGTPWLAPATVIAMKLGATLNLSAVDATALEHVNRAQALLASWHDDLQPVHVKSTATAPSAGGVGVGCFFSGGVDSFFSALRHIDDITHLIFVRGFDIPLTDEELGDRAAAAARAAATAMGKKLVEVRTNIRQLSDPHVSWGLEFHGAALAMVGLALAPHLSKVIIPSSTRYQGDLDPWGSHPDLDRLWSSSAVTFVHDGSKTARTDKVAAIARHQLALDHLRVCWENPGGAYNCGRCEKCLRTMISLRAVGALGSCRTLPSSLDVRAVRWMHVTQDDRPFAEDNLCALRASGCGDQELERALRTAIRVGRVLSLAGRLKRSGVRLMSTPLRTRTKPTQP